MELNYFSRPYNDESRDWTDLINSESAGSSRYGEIYIVCGKYECVSLHHAYRCAKIAHSVNPGEAVIIDFWESVHTHWGAQIKCNGLPVASIDRQSMPGGVKVYLSELWADNPFELWRDGEIFKTADDGAPVYGRSFTRTENHKEYQFLDA